ncbi:MAG: 16S rRNA (guanine(527)-N(7))-methyltransferase RsmG [Nitrospinales bacterium]
MNQTCRKSQEERTKEWIADRLRAADLAPPAIRDFDQAADQILCFIREIQRWNPKVRLTSEGDETSILERHFYDSLHFARVLPGARDAMDIGSGNGFPGIPLKIIFPETRMVLVESRRKRANFLREVVRKLNLENISVAEGRAERLAGDGAFAGCFDAVLFRAVAGLEDCLSLGAPYLRPGGRIVVKKDADAKAVPFEISPGLALSLADEISIRSWSGVESKLMVFQKCST